MNNERDSLCAFRLRIATFDSGWANAAAEQDALHTKEVGGAHPTRTIAFAIRSVDRYKKSTPKAGAQCAPYI